MHRCGGKLMLHASVARRTCAVVRLATVPMLVAADAVRAPQRDAAGLNATLGRRIGQRS